MKKKLVLGISAACLAGSFWACGSGDVINSDDSLEGLAVALLDQIDVADAVQKCGENPQCQAEMANPPDVGPASSETPVAQSSTTTPGQSSAVAPKSSMSFNFSSGGTIGGMSSAAVPTSSADAPVAVSSSSVTFAPGDLGACAANSKTGELNETLTYTFTWNSNSGVQPADIMSASYNWTLPDGTPAVSAGKKTASTTYATSGPKTATLVVAAGGKTQEVTCGVNVNGAKITGCKCDAVAATVDVAAGEIATWAVSGCTSTANIIAYTWGGAGVVGADAAATAALAAKGESATPTLSVANDDNTVVDVVCPTVKAVDSNLPDYVLGFAGTNIPSANDTSVAIPFNKEACIQISIDWQNTGWTPPGISLLCDVAPAQGSPGLKLDITYNGTSKSYSGDYNISNSGISLGAIRAGANVMKDVCVTVTGTEGGTAKCFFGN